MRQRSERASSGSIIQICICSRMRKTRERCPDRYSSINAPAPILLTSRTPRQPVQPGRGNAEGAEGAAEAPGRADREDPCDVGAAVALACRTEECQRTPVGRDRGAGRVLDDDLGGAACCGNRPDALAVPCEGHVVDTLPVGRPERVFAVEETVRDLRRRRGRDALRENLKDAVHLGYIRNGLAVWRPRGKSFK